MNLEDLTNIIKKFRFFIVLLVVVGLSLGGWTIFSSGGNYIPQSFTDARRESAIVGEQIVGLSSESSSGLEQVQKLQSEEKYTEALDAVLAERRRVLDMRSKGSELLRSLSAMTESLSEIRPEKSRTAALEAINYETGIVNHLLSYSQFLDQLMQAIASHILYGEDIKLRFDDLITKTNGEISAVDELNAKFTSAMVALERGGK
jgi:hypothetical protein